MSRSNRFRLSTAAGIRPRLRRRQRRPPAKPGQRRAPHRLDVIAEHAVARPQEPLRHGGPEQPHSDQASVSCLSMVWSSASVPPWRPAVGGSASMICLFGTGVPAPMHTRSYVMIEHSLPCFSCPARPARGGPVQGRLLQTAAAPFSEPVKQLTNALHEYHYVEHRGVRLLPWENARFTRLLDRRR